MKLTSVEIHPANSPTIAVLSFRNPAANNPYNVKAIVGLDADEIISKYYSASGSSKFYMLSLQKRELVIRIGLNPNFGTSQTYSDLRDALYKMIASSRTGKIQLQFKNNTDVIAILSGFVSKFEAPHFEKTQEVHITVKCDEPMLKAITPTIITVAGLNPASTNIQDTKSTAPHGFKFDLLINANIASVIITNPSDATWSFSIVPAGGFLTGDILHFSSESNDKYLYIVRAGNTIYLADAITPGSVWPIIFPGDNIFALTNPTSLVWNAISYYPTYWGV